MGLADLIGQPVFVRLITRLIARGRLPHALILEGVPGCGRRTAALALAQALLCSQPRDGDACGVCAACHQATAGTHPDLVAIPNDTDAMPADLAGDLDGAPPDLSRTLPVEWMRRRIAEAAYESPLMGHGRVFVIPVIERLNLPGANALLKVLEEPPPGTFLIMTAASVGSVLGTIRSRAQLYRLQPLAAADVERVLQRGGLSPADAAERARLAVGGHRDCWTAADPVPIDDLLRLARGGFSAEIIARLTALLPQRLADESDNTGRTLPGEQRRVARHWLHALVQRLRLDLRDGDGASAADLIGLVLHLLGDLNRNLAPRLVFEGLGLGPERLKRL